MACPCRRIKFFAKKINCNDEYLIDLLFVIEPHPSKVSKSCLVFVLMVNEHKESIEEKRFVNNWIEFDEGIYTTERNSSSASFKSCIRRRSRALIDKRNVRCFRSVTA